jgi:hypothetical protein
MIEFNNGFITAMGLFCNHGFTQDNYSGIELYAAKDHLLSMDFPVEDEELKDLVQSIYSANNHCFARNFENFYEDSFLFEQMAKKFNQYAQTDELSITIDGKSMLPLEILECLPRMDKTKYGLNVVVKHW